MVAVEYKYTVVELSGYIGENDRRSFVNFVDACNWIERVYEPSEIEELHVRIRKDFADGTRTYEY